MTEARSSQHCDRYIELLHSTVGKQTQHVYCQEEQNNAATFVFTALGAAVAVKVGS